MLTKDDSVDIKYECMLNTNPCNMCNMPCNMPVTWSLKNHMINNGQGFFPSLLIDNEVNLQSNINNNIVLCM